MITNRRYTHPNPAPLPSSTGLAAPFVYTSMSKSVPAERPVRTSIVLHRHQIVVQRTDRLYKVVAVLESILMVASTVALISLSAAICLMAANMLGMN